jgi:hypothetical protein
MLEGGCFCGFIRYQADGAPFHETTCHCTICRGTTGAPMVTWFTVARGALRFMAGQPTTFPSSDHGTRAFCPRCGTALTFQDASFPDEIDVTVCSLDHPERLPPRDHTFARSRLPWVVLGDDLPAFPRSRD